MSVSWPTPITTYDYVYVVASTVTIISIGSMSMSMLHLQVVDYPLHSLAVTCYFPRQRHEDP